MLASSLTGEIIQIWAVFGRSPEGTTTTTTTQMTTTNDDDDNDDDDGGCRESPDAQHAILNIRYWPGGMREAIE
jgi:hypothetical protein